MTLETANTVKNSAGTLYKDIETSKLAIMVNTMLKTPGLDDDHKHKMDAARTVLHFRTHPTQ